MLPACRAQGSCGMGMMLVAAAARLEEGASTRASSGAGWHDLANSLQVGMSIPDYPHSAMTASSTNHIMAQRDGRLRNAPPWLLWIHPQVLDRSPGENTHSGRVWVSLGHSSWGLG